MRPNNRIFLSLLLTAAAGSLSAQELAGSLTAEGQYKAEIRAHNRLSGLPSRLTLSIPEGELPLAYNGIPGELTPSLVAQLASDRGLGLPRSYRGYLSLWGGSYLNSSISAGYRFVDTPETTFGAWLQHNSSSLFRPKAADGSDTKLPYRRIYDESVGLYGSQVVGNGRISADAYYRLGYFNYVPNAKGKTSVGAPNYGWYPSQTLNDAGVRVAWQMNRPAEGLFADAWASFRYFGFRRYYMPGNQAPAVKPTRESDVNLHALVGWKTAASGTVSLDADARLLFYSDKGGDYVQDNNLANDADKYVNRPFSYHPSRIKNYGIASLTPAYSYTSGGWSLRAGVRLDMTWDLAYIKYNPLADDEFSHFHVAPDVALSYTADKFGVYLRAEGGVTPNTLASIAALDYYCSPSLGGTLPVYRPIDATIGLNLGSFSGFSAGIRASYAVAHNAPLSGWYPYWMYCIDPTGLNLDAYDNMTVKGFSLGANLKYELGKLLEVQGDLAYSPQSGDKGYFNGLDRPRWVLGLNADVHPMEGLTVGATYEYRGVRNLYLGQFTTVYGEVSARVDHNFTGPQPGDIIGLRLPDIYDLGVHASYTLKGRYTFSVRAQNLLDCQRTLIPLLPEEDLTVLGGIQILF